MHRFLVLLVLVLCTVPVLAQGPHPHGGWSVNDQNNTPAQGSAGGVFLNGETIAVVEFLGVPHIVVMKVCHVGVTTIEYCGEFKGKWGTYKCSLLWASGDLWFNIEQPMDPMCPLPMS